MFRPLAGRRAAATGRRRRTDGVPGLAAHARRLCGLRKPAAQFDGVSLAALLHGKPQPELAERKLVVQFGISEEYLGPTKWNCTVMWGKWRLVRGKELYDIKADRAEERRRGAAPRDRQAACATITRSGGPGPSRWPASSSPSTWVPITESCLPRLEDWVATNTANARSVREGVNLNGPWHVLVERAGPYEIACDAGRPKPTRRSARACRPSRACWANSGRQGVAHRQGPAESGRPRRVEPVARDDKAVTSRCTCPQEKRPWRPGSTTERARNFAGRTTCT